MNAKHVTPILNVSDIAESFAWFEKSLVQPAIQDENEGRSDIIRKRIRWDLVAGRLPGNKVSSGGHTPIGIARTGQWIAVANQNSNTISIFTVNSAGQLMQVGSTVNTVSAPFRLAFSQNGNYLFASSDSGMESFQFNTSTAALSPLNGGEAVADTAHAIAAQ